MRAWSEKPVGQMGVLAFIREEIASGHPFPTNGQIAAQFGWHEGSAADALMRLKAHGHLEVVKREHSGRGWKYTYRLAAPALALCIALFVSPTFAQDVFVPQGLKSSADFWRASPPKPRIRIIRIPYRVWRSDELKPCTYEAKR